MKNKNPTPCQNSSKLELPSRRNRDKIEINKTRTHDPHIPYMVHGTQ